MLIPEHIGAALTAVAYLRGLTLTDVASRIGIARPNLSASLLGTRPLRDDAFGMLVELLDLRAADGTVVPCPGVHHWRAPAAGDALVDTALAMMGPSVRTLWVGRYDVEPVNRLDPEDIRIVLWLGNRRRLLLGAGWAAVVSYPEDGTQQVHLHGLPPEREGERWLGGAEWALVVGERTTLGELTALFGAAALDWTVVADAARRSGVGAAEVLSVMVSANILTAEVAALLLAEADRDRLAIPENLVGQLRRTVGGQMSGPGTLL